MAILLKTASIQVSSIRITQVRVKNKGKRVWKSRYDGDVSIPSSPGKTNAVLKEVARRISGAVAGEAYTKNKTTIVLLKPASVSSMQIIPKPYKIVVNMA